MKKILIKLIQVYQKTFSPDHGIFKKPHIGCRFYPSCSNYALLALEKYNLPKALLKIIYRVIKCNPWHNGGVDYP